MLNLVDQYRALVGAYFGIREMDEYELKAYVLKDIDEYINNFLEKNKIEFDYLKEKNDVLDNTSLKVKLQDALNLLNDIDGDKELIFMIKKRIRKIERSE